MNIRKILTTIVFCFCISKTVAEDGYELWLRYAPISDQAVAESYRDQLHTLVFSADSPTLRVAKSELIRGLESTIGQNIHLSETHTDPAGADGVILVGTPESQPKIKKEKNVLNELKKLGREGYLITKIGATTIVAANTDIGVLYGVFELLRQVQNQSFGEDLHIASSPAVKHRLLNHWDNLNRLVERGYAGSSIWNWFTLPDYKDPRYTDYARACASIGINGTVLTNVNADSKILLPQYLERVAALADIFRPYGIKVYLTARFSSPMEIGGLATADPLDADVIRWWQQKTDEIYELIPNFGGFLVKANSEGQPGPQDFDRNHADGANMLAKALQPHQGIVMWRAFVYSHEAPDDRAKQAYNEFTPLDGTFEDNVLVQIKNGPIDFMPREPIHPLFGALPQTSIALELQITQEYLGASTQMAFLAPMWKECMDFDTFRPSRGNTVAKVVADSDGAIAGVSNIGSDRNWTGHPMAAANFYAFGRLAWDYQIPSEQIAREWSQMTFSPDPEVWEPIAQMLLDSHQIVVDYSMPLGLHHIMAMGHHHGPGPWVDGIRADWTSVYYHKSDEDGIGFDRTINGSNALGQYAEEVQKQFNDPMQCPPGFLLWFHHLDWDFMMPSGNTLWNELCLTYQSGVDRVSNLQVKWNQLAGKIDHERHAHVASLLTRQFHESEEWRDACLLYFQTFSKRNFPEGVQIKNSNLEELKKRKYFVPGN